jgi:hypothetical protein
MKASLSLPLLFALGTSAATVFTSPDTGTPLNVSAPTITVAWGDPDAGTIQGLRYLTVDMQFIMPQPGDAERTSDTWTEHLVTNHTLTAGVFEWDPTKVREYMESHPDATEERQKATVRFQVALRGRSDGGFVPDFSEVFRVGGYEGHEGSVAAMTPAWLLLAAAFITAVHF